MWQNGIAIICRMRAMGSVESDARQSPKMLSSPWVWQLLQT